MTKEIIEKNEQLDEVRKNALFLVRGLLFQMTEQVDFSEDEVMRGLIMIDRELSSSSCSSRNAKQK